MIHSLPPGTIMIVGGLLIPLIWRNAQSAMALILSIASLAIFLLTPSGEYGQIELFGQSLVLAN
jgi:multicomponent Na+:H+ antiporter subunit D